MVQVVIILKDKDKGFYFEEEVIGTLKKINCVS